MKEKLFICKSHNTCLTVKGCYHAKPHKEFHYRPIPKSCATSEDILCGGVCISYDEDIALDYAVAKHTDDMDKAGEIKSYNEIMDEQEA